MGIAFCRFKEETGCAEIASEHYLINLEDLEVRINVPAMWKHYMTEHLVQPTEKERETIMAANPDRTSGTLIGTRSASEPKEVKIMYVEKIDGSYSHEIGNKADTEFIEKLETI